MKCVVCGKTKEEADLFEGIYEGDVVDICSDCAELEEVPLIKKPNQERVDAALQSKSVRERLEGMEQGSETRSLSKDQEVANKFLSKIKFPSKKDNPDNLVENYYWIIQRARRKKGVTLRQLSVKLGVSEDVLKGIEYGKLPKTFEPIIRQLEEVLDLQLIKRTQEETMREKVEKIIEERKEKQKEEAEQEKKQKLGEIERGEMDFSKRDKIENITLNDLIDLKRKRDKDAMMGDDIELAE